MLVELNVGGTHFATHQSTLEKFPDSLLCAALRNSSSAKDAKGRLFFDRDPELFSRLLNMIRSPEHSVVIDYRLAQEAEYYCLPFEQNAFVIDTGEGDYYFSPEDYSKFIHETKIQTIGPRGHLVFPCTKKRLEAWKDLDHIDIEDYIFWQPILPQLLHHELTLTIKGISFEKVHLSSMDLRDLQWLYKCYSDPRSLERLALKWQICKAERWQQFSTTFIRRALDLD